MVTLILLHDNHSIKLIASTWNQLLCDLYYIDPIAFLLRGRGLGHVVVYSEIPLQHELHDYANIQIERIFPSLSLLK